MCGEWNFTLNSRIALAIDGTKKSTCGSIRGPRKKLYAHSVDEVNSLFQEILCENRVPDLTRWRNCTKEIYLERFRRKKNGCDS